MILNLTEIFVNEAFLKLNERFENALKIRKVDVSLEQANLPVSMQAINYNIFITGIESLSSENNKFSNANVRIEFYFMMARKNNDNYKYILDKYLFDFMRLLRAEELRNRILYDADVSQGLRITDVLNVNLVDGNNLVNEFYRPSIEMTLKIYDTLGSNILSTNNIL